MAPEIPINPARHLKILISPSKEIGLVVTPAWL